MIGRAPRLDEVDQGRAPGKAEYEERLLALQHRLRDIQTAYINQGRRAIVLLEGWDASGKGGLIKRLTEELDPRFYRVWPISAPDEHERKRHYLYRFWRRLPGRGELAVFDRSWYGRVLVERVEGFASEAEWRRAFDEINAFEATQCADGTRVIKLFLHVSQEVQDERLRERIETPWKRWKTGLDDYRNRARRADYAVAIDAMFERTHTVVSPWHIIGGDHKKRARLDGLAVIAERLAHGVDLAPPPPDAELVRAAQAALGRLNIG